MFISYKTIVYFFVNNFFSNVYILVNTIFKSPYLSFGREIVHTLSMYVTRGMEGIIHKRKGVSHFMCTYAYTLFLFMFLSHGILFSLQQFAFVSYCSIHICNCVEKNFLEQPYGRNSYSECVHLLTKERVG